MSVDRRSFGFVERKLRSEFVEVGEAVSLGTGSPGGVAAVLLLFQLSLGVLEANFEPIKIRKGRQEDLRLVDRALLESEVLDLSNDILELVDSLLWDAKVGASALVSAL